MRTAALHDRLTATEAPIVFPDSDALMQVVNSLFQHQDDVVIRLVRSDEIHDPGVASGHLQDSHLMGDLSPAVSTSTPLPDELGSKDFPRGLIHTALHHCKLPPDEPQSHH